MLKEWGHIFQAKVDHSRYVGSKDGFKSSFILISSSNLMVFVAPPDVELGEQLFACQFFQLCPNVREGTIVSYYPFVESSVVHYHMPFIRILFANQKDGGSVR